MFLHKCKKIRIIIIISLNIIFFVYSRLVTHIIKLYKLSNCNPKNSADFEVSAYMILYYCFQNFFHNGSHLSEFLKIKQVSSTVTKFSSEIQKEIFESESKI